MREARAATMPYSGQAGKLAAYGFTYSFGKKQAISLPKRAKEKMYLCAETRAGKEKGSICEDTAF